MVATYIKKEMQNMLCVTDLYSRVIINIFHVVPTAFLSCSVYLHTRTCKEYAIMCIKIHISEVLCIHIVDHVKQCVHTLVTVILPYRNYHYCHC